jgi:hypothetical protein
MLDRELIKAADGASRQRDRDGRGQRRSGPSTRVDVSRAILGHEFVGAADGASLVDGEYHGQDLLVLRRLPFVAGVGLSAGRVLDPPTGLS